MNNILEYMVCWKVRTHSNTSPLDGRISNCTKRNELSYQHFFALYRRRKTLVYRNNTVKNVNKQILSIDTSAFIIPKIKYDSRLQKYHSSFIVMIELSAQNYIQGSCTCIFMFRLHLATYTIIFILFKEVINLKTKVI